MTPSNGARPYSNLGKKSSYSVDFFHGKLSLSTVDISVADDEPNTHTTRRYIADAFETAAYNLPFFAVNLANFQ